MEERREYEAWALTRAYEIVSREGFSLVVAAQNLDKKNTKANSYNLLQAIAKSLMEVQSSRTVA